MTVALSYKKCFAARRSQRLSQYVYSLRETEQVDPSRRMSGLLVSACVTGPVAPCFNDRSVPFPLSPGEDARYTT